MGGGIILGQKRLLGIKCHILRIPVDSRGKHPIAMTSFLLERGNFVTSYL